MARKPAVPPSPGAAEPGRAKTGEPTGRDDRAAPSERFGPLAIERMSKDDGRALIVYSHEEPGQA
jgi:hypothetical protein